MTTSNPDSNGRSTGSMPDDADNGTTKQKMKEDARDVKRELGARAREEVETGQHQIADEAGNLSDAIDAAASSLDDDDREGLARYARQLSNNLANAAGQLEGRSVDELANDAKRLARTNPALFMLGSIAVGFGLSRFLKASAKHDHSDHSDHSDKESTYRTDDHLKDDTFGDHDFSTSTSAPEQSHERTMSEPNTTSPSQHNGDGRNMP